MVDQRSMKTAKSAIQQIAQREGVSEDDVRKQMEVAIRNGLASDNPQSKAYWQSIPCEGAIPTPEEFILFSAQTIMRAK